MAPDSTDTTRVTVPHAQEADNVHTKLPPYAEEGLSRKPSHTALWKIYDAPTSICYGQGPSTDQVSGVGIVMPPMPHLRVPPGGCPAWLTTTRSSMCGLPLP